jgi:hypothetical protein
MKQKLNKILCAVALLVACFFNTAVATPPYVLYNNVGQVNNYSLLMQLDGQEEGTTISLPGEAWLSSIELQYNAPNSFLGDNLAVRLSIYNNNGGLIGGYASPGTQLWSGLYTGIPDNFVTQNHNLYFDTSDFGIINVTGSFTISAAFYNLSTPNQLYGIQLPLAGNPSGYLGSSYGDYWYSLNNSPWALGNGPGGPGTANMLMSVEATPEPSTLALAAIGGVLLLGVNKLKRKRA